jgi:hypothetical protein
VKRPRYKNKAESTIVGPLGHVSVHEVADVPMLMTEPHRNATEQWLWGRQFNRRMTRMLNEEDQ